MSARVLWLRVRNSFLIAGAYVFYGVRYFWLPLLLAVIVVWYTRDIAFDSEAWRAQGNVPSPYDGSDRMQMAEDLKGSGTLEGRTRSEVYELLGPVYLDDEEWQTLSTFYYILGSGLIDTMILSVTFGTDGRVQEVTIFGS